MKEVLNALALTVAFTSIALCQAPQKHEMTDSQKAEMRLYPAAEIQWKDGPSSLPAGAKVAVLEGDPAKEGHDASLVARRLQDSTPTASKVEHVTVISGTFNVGIGDRFD